MPLDLLLDFAHGLDPAVFAEDRLGFRPDPWQSRVLRSRARWILLNCCRQSGKSTTTALVALHTAIYDPGLILLVSPSLRQSEVAPIQWTVCQLTVYVLVMAACMSAS
jgi:isoprenylcysteine carboxyl methyltransferase (ICMT) family protein YpbQ